MLPWASLYNCKNSSCLPHSLCSFLNCRKAGLLTWFKGTVQMKESLCAVPINQWFPTRGPEVVHEVLGKKDNLLSLSGSYMNEASPTDHQKGHQMACPQLQLALPLSHQVQPLGLPNLIIFFACREDRWLHAAHDNSNCWNCPWSCKGWESLL